MKRLTEVNYDDPKAFFGAARDSGLNVLHLDGDNDNGTLTFETEKERHILHCYPDEFHDMYEKLKRNIPFNAKRGFDLEERVSSLESEKLENKVFCRTNGQLHDDIKCLYVRNSVLSIFVAILVACVIVLFVQL